MEFKAKTHDFYSVNDIRLEIFAAAVFDSSLILSHLFSINLFISYVCSVCFVLIAHTHTHTHVLYANSLSLGRCSAVFISLCHRLNISFVNKTEVTKVTVFSGGEL